MGAVAVLMPLLVLFTTVTGFTEIARLDARSTQLSAALDSQRDTEVACQAIRADVWEALVLGGDPAATPYAANRKAALRTRTQAHLALLRTGTDGLDLASLPGDFGYARSDVLAALGTFGVEGRGLVELALAEPARARQAAVNLSFALDNLQVSQDRLTAGLESDAAAVHSATLREQVQVALWTSVLAGLMWLALLAVGLMLARFARDRAALVRRLEGYGAELAEANEQLKTAQSLALVGSWEWSSATGRVKGSPEFYSLLGLVAEELSPDADPLLEHVHPDDRPVMLAQRSLARQEHQGGEAAYRMIRADGAERSVLVRVTVRVASDGTFRVLGALQDVTDLRAVEKLKSEFVSVISHELRTPLTSIRGALGLLASGAIGRLTPEGQRMAEVAVGSSDRLVRLINDILDVEKLAAGKMRLHLAPHGLLRLVEAAESEMRPMADEAGVLLRADAVVGTVLVDADRIAQTLTNLLNNAIKFSPAGSEVRVSARREGDLIHVRISNQGPDIAADQLEVIFDRFQQLDSSDSREQGGTGLGLSISRGIVEQHGGTIWATSRDGTTTFEFTLPRASEEEPAPSDPTTAQPQLSSSGSGG